MVWCCRLFKNFPPFVVIHTVQGFSIVHEAEVDVFLEFPCFLYDPMNVDSLISGSSACSKLSWYIWKFSVHILLKPSLKDFDHKLTSMWNEHNSLVAWTFFGIAFLWNWNESWPFLVLWPLLSFHICWQIEYNTLTASFFWIWNSLPGMLLPPLALFIVMLPKAHLTSHSRTSGSRWVITLSWFSGSLRPVLYGMYILGTSS